MRFHAKITVLLFLCFSIFESVILADDLVPAPRKMDHGKGAVPFSGRILTLDKSYAPQAEAFADGLRRLGVDATLKERESGEPATGDVLFGYGSLPKGITYRIAVRDEIVRVTAANPIGAAQAAASLLLLARLDEKGASWPVVSITDGPGLAYRSFLVDMGRNPHSPATLRHVVDMCWFYKVNLLQLHLIDDQLCSWPSREFPKLKNERAGWILDDFVELEAYARARGVTLIPELEVPAHSGLLRKHYPEVFGRTPSELAEKPEAREGIKKLLAEMISVFSSSPYVHIGADEAYGVDEKLQRDLINDLNRYLKTLGKRTVVWEGPRLGKGDSKVAEDVIHMNWRTINFPAAEMLKAGYEVVNASWDPLYIVDHYPRTMFTAVDLKRCYDWDLRVFAHVNPGIPTFGKPHRVDSAKGIIGFCMPWWEGRERNLLPLCLPRLAAVSCAAWNRKGERDFESFLERNERAMARFRTMIGVPEEPMPRATEVTPEGNLAFGRPVRVSAGAHQPPFVPERLTNGITDRFDLFLGYPTVPEPLKIVIELEKPVEISRIVVYETAVGKSWEDYRVEVSEDGKRFVEVGVSGKGTRGEKDHVIHVFPARKAALVRIVTKGCKDFVFASFSRLTEVQVFESPR